MENNYDIASLGSRDVLSMAALVPAGVYFTATLFFPPDQVYTYVGQGTGAGSNRWRWASSSFPGSRIWLLSAD